MEKYFNSLHLPQMLVKGTAVVKKSFQEEIIMHFVLFLKEELYNT